MKYKVGDYLAGKSTVLFFIVAAMQGEDEIYATRTIKHPTDLQWFTGYELEHGKIIKVTPNLAEFHLAEQGDLVDTGDGVVVKILIRAHKALLVSRSIDNSHRPILQFAGAIKEATGADIIPPEAQQHMRQHSTLKYVHSAADSWYDEDVMALMNWKLIKEEQ